MPCIMKLIQKDLSEPYSIYTYRYFIHNWPRLCFLWIGGLAEDDLRVVRCMVCDLLSHSKWGPYRCYIASALVFYDNDSRKILMTLGDRATTAAMDGNFEEVVLETEITNKAAQKLYENLGFVRDKRLFRYYLNGRDALRLKLWLR
nr:EOG090X07BN [Artemia franciscana]